MEGLAHFLQTIKTVKSALNPGLEIEGGVLTMFDSRMVLSNQVKVEVEKYFDKSLFKTIIPRNIRLAEAPGFGQCIFQYDPKSKGAEAYADFAREFLSRRGIAEDAAEEDKKETRSRSNGDQAMRKALGRGLAALIPTVEVEPIQQSRPRTPRLRVRSRSP